MIFKTIRRLITPSLLRHYSASVMTLEEVEKSTLNVLKTFNKVNQEKLSLDAKLTTDLGLDSLDVVEVVMALEEAFVTEIPDAEADKFNTARDAVLFIHSKMAGH